MWVDREELIMLAEVGLFAAVRRDCVAALAIFSAIERERPDAAVAFVGPALALLQVGRFSEAIHVLKRGLSAVEHSSKREIYAVLGLAYQVDGQLEESRKALQCAGSVPMAKALLRQGKPGLSED